jgi:hypothetical protein
MDFHGIIYVWLCTVTGLSYIGLSKSSSKEQTRRRIDTPEKLLYNRWRGHIYQSIYGPFDYFHNAIRKYGHENFQGTILKVFHSESLEDIKKQVDIAEKEYITSFNTLAPNGYNLQTGGRSPVCHDDTKQKLKIKLESYFKSSKGQEQLTKQSTFLKEFFNTDEGKMLRDKLSICAKKRWEDSDYRRNQIEKGTERFEGPNGEIRKDNLRQKVFERLENPIVRQQASEKTREYFDKIGRKEYKCELCDNKVFRDKTAYFKHCNTSLHKKREEGYTCAEAKRLVQNETCKKISESNKKYAETHTNPRKGKTHTAEAKEKNRLAHIGKTLPESARNRLSKKIREQYEKGERKSVKAKLTDEQVRYIRKNKGVIKQNDLATQFSVSVSTISAIQKHLVYKNISDDG